MSAISKEVYRFLKAYAQWAYIDEAPDHPYFRKYMGLCGNAKFYGVGVAYTTLSKIFKSQNLDELDPFDCSERNKTLNPRRKAWILKTIKEYEDANNVR